MLLVAVLGANKSKQHAGTPYFVHRNIKLL
jgi:hypothetical protein